MKKSNTRILIIILAVVAVMIAVASYLNCRGAIDVKYSEFYSIVDAKADGSEDNYQKRLIELTNYGAERFTDVKAEMTDVNINSYNITFAVNVTYKNGTRESENTIYYKTTYTRTAEIDKDLQDQLNRAEIAYSCADPNAGSIWSSLIPIIGCVLVAVVFFVIIMQMQGGTKSAINFSKTQARLNKDLKVRFSDVAGAEEEKEELAEVVEFLKSPKKFSDLGARIPKGVLLVGPPGTGKTLFAKAVAGEAGVPFFSISGSDFVEMFVGVGASRVRDLFDTAKKSMPCIVFIDEIDAVGRQRGTGLGGGHDEREQTLNQLLVQMDGFETNEGIIVMAATNRADILDPALLRPGRFDRQIYVNIPDVKGREAILKVHSRNKPLAADVNFKIVARMTSGFSGADLENLLNEAAILAARNNRRSITNKDLYEGINKVLIGPQKKSRLVTETDKRITAYHEAGHAVLARKLKNCDPVHEVSIIPRGRAAGYTMTRPDNDDNHLTKAKLLDDIAMTLGGRVAEELIIKDISAGASGDIEAVSKRARLMVTEWGMSDRIGPISYSPDKEVFIGKDLTSHVTYSEETAGIIDEEIDKIIKTQLEVARKQLAENKAVLDNMARLLVERETIFAEEVDMLMDGRSVEEIMAFMDENEKTLQENPFARKSAKDEKDSEKIISKSAESDGAPQDKTDNEK